MKRATEKLLRDLEWAKAEWVAAISVQPAEFRARMRSNNAKLDALVEARQAIADAIEGNETGAGASGQHVRGAVNTNPLRPAPDYTAQADRLIELARTHERGRLVRAGGYTVDAAALDHARRNLIAVMDGLRQTIEMYREREPGTGLSDRSDEAQARGWKP